MTDRILQTYQISDEIISLVENSRQFCFLVTPFYKPWPKFQKALETAAAEKKNIVFILNADEENRIDISHLNTVYKFDIIYVERLHTRLFVSDQTAIISSLNLYDSSRENSFEIGFKIESKRDIRELVETIIQDDILRNPPASVLQGRFYNSIERLYKEQTSRISTPVYSDIIIDERDLRQQAESAKAYCIRCRKKIPMSVYRTFCQNCFEEWEQEQPSKKTETYCHLCGKDADVTKTKALCYDCYSNLEVW